MDTFRNRVLDLELIKTLVGREMIVLCNGSVVRLAADLNIDRIWVTQIGLLNSRTISGKL